MNKRIARVLVEDLRTNLPASGGTVIFHDDTNVYTVTVTVDSLTDARVREHAGQAITTSPSLELCRSCYGSGLRLTLMDEADMPSTQTARDLRALEEERTEQVRKEQPSGT